LEGITIAKLQKKYLGRKPGTKEDSLSFLSKPKNRKAIQLLKKGYKMTEVSSLAGISINTVTKVKKLMLN
jgi:DNA invertase Pin-like site-specific DNA recombinase